MSLGIKRLLDILLSGILFVVLFPFMLIIAIVVGTTSRGGIFFCQERVTTYGRKFKIIKFRTMVAVHLKPLASFAMTFATTALLAAAFFWQKEITLL